LSYKNAHKMAEKIVGLARSSKEATVEEMVILNNREELVVITMDER
jgi:hypothetical protein